jgi:hypothetical protein
MNYVLAGLIGLVGGVSSGLFGVGGGIVMVPAMMLLLAMPIHTAVGTSLAVIIPTAIMGSCSHARHGNVALPTALALMPTAILGGLLGAWLANQLSAGNLKRAFGGFLILVGIRLLFFK